MDPDQQTQNPITSAPSEAPVPENLPVVSGLPYLIEHTKEQISKPKAYALVGVLALSIIFTSLGVSKLISVSPLSDQAALVSAATEEKAGVFPNVAIEAKAAVVFDLKEGKILFSKNGEVQLPLASLTKVMMALTALDLLPEESVVTIKPEFLMEDGSSGFRIDQQWKFEDLLEATLVASSNDGAAAIAGAYSEFLRDRGEEGNIGVEEKFVRAMNDKARSIGLVQTYFLNPTGLDENERLSGGYGSALDMVKLLNIAVSKFPRAFSATDKAVIKVSSLGNTEYEVKNTNPFVQNIPGLIASKTGFTDLAGGNLVIIFDAGLTHPVGIAVLGSTREGRFSDTITLTDATLEYLTSLNP